MRALVRSIVIISIISSIIIIIKHIIGISIIYGAGLEDRQRRRQRDAAAGPVPPTTKTGPGGEGIICI